MQSAPEYSESCTRLIRDGDDSSLASHATSLYRRDDDANITTRASISGGERIRHPRNGEGDGDKQASDYEQFIAEAEQQRQPQRRYGSLGQFTSEEAYLAELRAWIHEKQFYQPGEMTTDGSRTLVGFYGKTTMEEYANRPGLGLGRRKNKQEGRRATVDETGNRGKEGEEERPRRKSSGIGDLLRKQRGR